MIGLAWPRPAFSAGRRSSPFQSWVNGVLLVLVVGLFIGANLWLITERHAASRAQQRMCAEEIRVEIRRKPILANTVRLADACATLRRMRGQG